MPMKPRPTIPIRTIVKLLSEMILWSLGMPERRLVPLFRGVRYGSLMALFAHLRGSRGWIRYLVRPSLWAMARPRVLLCERSRRSHCERIILHDSWTQRTSFLHLHSH